MQLDQPVASNGVPQLDRLIAALGGDVFVSSLLSSARDLVGCDHVTVFAIDPAGRLIDRHSVSLQGDTKITIAGTNFLARIWPRNPALLEDGIRVSHSQAGFRIGRRLWTDIADSEYREICYRQVGTVDRLTLQRQNSGVTLSLNFYRDRRSGPFDDADIAALAGAGQVYLSAAGRHQELSDRNPRRAIDVPLPGQDGRWGPYRLSRREFEIAERICLGMTSEGIALDLSISMNTVLTYRKRIYGKLGITSQRELLALRYRRSDAVAGLD
jgi:DNA-binding CsgD family transcriptional regulator